MGKYARLVETAKNRVDYWARTAMRSFTTDLGRRMAAKQISKARLAELVGVSPAYISKVMHGNVNFTLETMTKLALAVGGRVRLEIVDVHDDSRADAEPWQLQRVVLAQVHATGQHVTMTAANDGESGWTTGTRHESAMAA